MPKNGPWPSAAVTGDRPGRLRASVRHVKLNAAGGATSSSAPGRLLGGDHQPLHDVRRMARLALPPGPRTSRRPGLDRRCGHERRQSTEKPRAPALTSAGKAPPRCWLSDRLRWPRTERAWARRLRIMANTTDQFRSTTEATSNTSAKAPNDHVHRWSRFMLRVWSSLLGVRRRPAGITRCRLSLCDSP